MRKLATSDNYVIRPKAKSDKIPKEAVLYIFRPETQYTCDKCVHDKLPANKDITKGKCAILAATEDIKPYGSCGFWIHMDPLAEATPDVPFLGVMTKDQVGYAENKTGFSCKRCEYFDPSRMDCEKVDKDSIGDTPGIIHPNACCNRWEPDDTRAKMTTEQLNKLFSPTTKP